MESDDGVEWKSFSLTHVKYPKGDYFGFVLAFISLTPFAIFVSYITLILFKREVDTILLCIGQLLNEILNFVLKNIICEKRPHLDSKAIHTPKTYGMPSQHAQFQAFFVVFSILFIAFKLRHKPWYFRTFCSFSLVTSLCGVVYSRIYLLYHFWSQCLVGVLVGTLWSCLWFAFVYGHVEPNYFNKLLSLPIMRFFGVTRFISPKAKNQRKYS
ncbi:Dolichyldiphosphatase 1 [Halotydeus destructor]|nr:Dolichyldiphosphatase 1 [Halotydeus destructor]